MDRFNIIVIFTGAAFLILMLSLLMAFTGNKRNTTTFVPPQLNCPDYWTFDGSGCIMPTCSPGNPPVCSNTGTLIPPNPTAVPTPSNWKNADNTNIYGLSQNRVDFNAAEWNTHFTSTGQSQKCGLRTWAISNNIEWDGLTNFSGC